MVVPRKNRRKSPARPNARSRAFTRVVEPNPAMIFACSRSMTRVRASSCRSFRSRACKTIPRRLFPIFEYVIGGATEGFLALRDIPFDVSAHSSVAISGTVKKVGVVNLGYANERNLGLDATV